MKGFILGLFMALAAQAQVHFDGLQVRENKGVITVLEAPLFYTPDKYSPVVQYVRKGEEIYIHPAEFAQDRYSGVVNETESEVEDYREEYSRDFSDPLFDSKEDIYDPDESPEFYKTISSSGKDAYILKEHVFLLYKDTRELDQEVANPDPTDYRIQEPLPKGYPIIQPSGQRSQINIALGTPSAPAYPYDENIQDIGYGFYKELSGIWGRNVDPEVTDRFFFGGQVTLSHFETEFRLENRQSLERNFKFGAGPLVSYDFWRNETYRLNAQFSAPFIFLDLVDVEQKSGNESDSRSFSSYYLAPRVSLSYQRPKVVSGLDLVIGSNISWELPHEYATQDEPDFQSWWKGDRFDRPTHFQITYFLGLQHSI